MLQIDRFRQQIFLWYSNPIKTWVYCVHLCSDKGFPRSTFPKGVSDFSTCWQLTAAAYNEELYWQSRRPYLITVGFDLGKISFANKEIRTWKLKKNCFNFTKRALNLTRFPLIPVLVYHIILIYLLTYSMVQSPSLEANWFAASQ